MSDRGADGDRDTIRAARIAFAAVLLLILTMFLGIVTLAPLFNESYRVEATVVVPVVLTLSGSALMLLGIEVAYLTRNGK